LATTIDARVHCAVLKIRAAPRQNPPHPRRVITDLRRKPHGRSLRTQQRAKPPHRRRRRSAPRRRRTNRPCRISSQLASAPPSCPPGTSARDTAPAAPPAGKAPGAP
jgi:hypothetical protein